MKEEIAFKLIELYYEKLYSKYNLNLKDLAKKYLDILEILKGEE